MLEGTKVIEECTDCGCRPAERLAQRGVQVAGSLAMNGDEAALDALLDAAET
jgi:hypothetical protein